VALQKHNMEKALVRFKITNNLAADKRSCVDLFEQMNSLDTKDTHHFKLDLNLFGKRKKYLHLTHYTLST
jgi:hypothetical protein